MKRQGKMAAITDLKNVSKQLNDSICSAFKLDNEESFLSISFDDIDSSWMSLEESLNNVDKNLDDTLIIGKKIRKRGKSLDESVHFVDEYIIESDTTSKIDKNNLTNIRWVPVLQQKAQKRKRRNSGCAADDNGEILSKKFKNELHYSTPIKKSRKADLFTASEQKKNEIYNKNTFNPYGNDEIEDEKRMVILDGSNIAFHHSLGKEFSVKGLEISIKYFEKMGHKVKAVVPQFRLQRIRSTDPNRLEYLNGIGKIVFTPCKNLPGMNSTCYDDRFILQLAVEFDGVIISNDNYRDLLYENPGFKKMIQNRVVGYTWCNDMFILPKDPYGKYGPHLDDILNRNC